MGIPTINEMLPAAEYPVANALLLLVVLLAGGLFLLRIFLHARDGHKRER